MKMQQSTPDEIEMLLAFVRDRDASCPNCGYNVRDLTKPICPECQEELLLAVGARIYPIIWLLITIAPGVFTGITAGVVAVVIAIEWPPKFVPLGAIVLATFFLLSAVTAIVITINYKRFIRQPRAQQVLWAVGTWVVHLAAFFTFVYLVI